MKKALSINCIQAERCTWKRFLVQLLFACAIFYFMFWYILGLSVVVGGSMQPTYPDKSLLLFSRVSDIERGDVAAIQSEKAGAIVKRVIAIPGDTVSIHGGQTYLNGEPLDEPYVVYHKENDSMEAVTVPKGYYFFMGDNRPTSEDSRGWISLVPESEVMGVVLIRFF